MRFRRECGSPCQICGEGFLFRYRLSLVGSATHSTPSSTLQWCRLTCSHVCTYFGYHDVILFFCFCFAFATYQENRLLHWTVEHPDDIARSNFLRGDHAHFFTNLDRVSSQQEAMPALNRLRFAPTLSWTNYLELVWDTFLQLLLGVDPYTTYRKNVSYTNSE